MSPDTKSIYLTAGQMRAARGLLGISGDKLADLSGVSLVAIRRAEGARGSEGMMRANAEAIRRALEQAGIEFIPENGGGPGVRLRGGSGQHQAHEPRSVGPEDETRGGPQAPEAAEVQTDD